MKMEFLRHEAKANDDIKNDNSRAHQVFMHVGKECCVPDTARVHANLNVISKERSQVTLQVINKS